MLISTALSICFFLGCQLLGCNGCESNRLPNSKSEFSIEQLEVSGSGNRSRITIRAVVPLLEPDQLSYRIERSKDAGPFSVIEDSFTPAYLIPYSEFLDDGLELGATYAYRITPLIAGKPAGPFQTDQTKLVGTVYYFSTNGKDLYHGKSPEAPKATLEALFGLGLKAGDMVRFHSGETFSTSKTQFWDGLGAGTAENPITITSYGEGEKPVFQIRDNRGISLRNTHDWTLDNLKLSGARKTQLEVYATNSGSNTYNIKLLRLEVDGKGAEPGHPNVNFHVEGKAVLGPPSTQKHHIDKVEVANSTFRNAGNRSGNSDAIRLWAVRSRGHVHHNSFYGNGAEACDIAGGADHIFEYNYVDGEWVDWSTGSKAHGQYYPLERVLYRFNIIRNCRNNALSLQDSQDGWVYHNTVDMPDHGYGVFFFYGKNYSDQHPQIIKNNRVFNNIFRGGYEGFGPMTVFLNGQLTDPAGKFGGPIRSYMGTSWETDGKVTGLDHNLYSTTNINQDCIIRYVYQESDGSYAETFPERGKGLKPVCVSRSSFDKRWAPFHANDQIGSPKWNATSPTGYSLKEGSPGVNMAMNLNEMLHKNLRDFSNRPILYNAKSSNVGANVYCAP